MTTLTACRMIAPRRHSRYDHVTKVTTIAGHNYYSANAKTTATMDKRHLQRHRSPNHTTTLCVWRYHTACMCTSSEAIRMLNTDFTRITKHAMALLYQTQLPWRPVAWSHLGTTPGTTMLQKPPRYLCKVLLLPNTITFHQDTCVRHTHNSQTYVSMCVVCKQNDVTRAWKTSNCLSINVKTMHNT